MTAHLLIMLATASGIIGVTIPFQDMPACESFLADPTPIGMLGEAVPVIVRCVNAPSTPPTHNWKPT